MQRSKLCLASLLILLAQADVGLGKPRSPIEKLMRQKVSAFSFGLFRLEKDIQSLLGNLKETDKDIIGARVGYDRGRDLIIIDLLGQAQMGYRMWSLKNVAEKHSVSSRLTPWLMT